MFTSPASRHSLCALGAVLLLATAAAPARTECRPATPDEVLKCLVIAHAEQDLDAYASLLAPDYVLRSGENEASREQDLAMTAKLFENASSLAVSYDDGYRVVPGDAPNTWRIVDLNVRVQMVTTDGKGYDVSSPVDYIEVVQTPGEACRIRAFATPASQ